MQKRYKRGPWLEEEMETVKQFIESQTWGSQKEIADTLIKKEILERSTDAIITKISLMVRCGDARMEREDGNNNIDEYKKEWIKAEKHAEEIKSIWTSGNYYSREKAGRAAVEKFDIKVDGDALVVWAKRQGWPFRIKQKNEKQTTKLVKRSMERREQELAARELREKYKGGRLILADNYKPKVIPGVLDIGTTVYVEEVKGVVIKEYPCYYLVDTGKYLTTLHKA